MAGKRMTITDDMPFLSLKPMQIQTINNWSPCFTMLGALEAGIKRATEKTWAAQYVMEIESASPHIVYRLLDSLIEITTEPTYKIEYKYTESRNSKFNGVGEDELLMCTSNRFDPLVIPILMIGTYRAFIQRKAGPIPGLNMSITVAGARLVNNALGLPFDDSRE